MRSSNLFVREASGRTLFVPWYGSQRAARALPDAACAERLRCTLQAVEETSLLLVVAAAFTSMHAGVPWYWTLALVPPLGIANVAAIEIATARYERVAIDLDTPRRAQETQGPSGRRLGLLLGVSIAGAAAALYQATHGGSRSLGIVGVLLFGFGVLVFARRLWRR
jgi:hypothetical protein